MRLEPEDEDLRPFLENDSPRSLMIEHHWEENFPKQYKALKEAGTLKQEAREATVRYARVHSQAVVKLGEAGATELANLEWQHPPNL